MQLVNFLKARLAKNKENRNTKCYIFLFTVDLEWYKLSFLVSCGVLKMTKKIYTNSGYYFVNTNYLSDKLQI